MTNRVFVAMLALVMVAGCTAGRKPDLQAQADIADALAPSLVRVQYALRYDKGEAPGFGRSALEEERPLEVRGYLVAPTRVLTGDHFIHPRFIERVTVAAGGDVVGASPVAYGKRHNAHFLELERPLKGAAPLAFDPSKGPPYFQVVYGENDGAWRVSVEGFTASAEVTDDGDRLAAAPTNVLVADRDGVPVGLSMNGELPADDSWKGSPLDWPVYTAEAYEALLADIEDRCNRALVRTTLHLRSPKRDAEDRYSNRDDADSATEIQAIGIVLEGRRVLVLANLTPRVTARLKRIELHLPDARTVGATFAGTLADYGFVMAETDEPVPGAIRLATRPIRTYRHTLVPAVEIRLHGENRTAYVNHYRFRGLHEGWRGQVYLRAVDRDKLEFLFDADGALLAMPVEMREKVSVQRRWSSDRARLTPVVYVKQVLDDLAANLDAGNVPLPEDEEARLAWLGVILQPLGTLLARANHVAELTRDGETGAFISYVYADSPAAKAGIKPGDILLRLRAEGRPEPIEVKLEEQYDRGLFPWDRMDELSDMYYDRIPLPWHPAENSFTRALTDLGFGRKFEADFFIDSKVVAKPFEVAASPPHFNSAPRCKSDALGLTVRDLTYEVRRYFQKAPDEPGVIVSKVEPGSKASVAGIKPYEVVTHVNGVPVSGAKDFEKAIAAGGELRLSVKRMTQGRVVKLSLEGKPADAG